MKKGIEAIKRTLESIQKKEAKVGFFDTAHYPDGTPVAYVATIQEFGYGPIPPRPFMRPAQEQNKDKWLNGIARGVKQALDGKVDIVDVLEQVGMVAAGDVRKAIKAVTAPALADSTVAARKRRLSKRSAQKANPITISKPLVDTGLMIQSVTSAVVDR